MKSNLFDMLIDLIGSFLKKEAMRPDIEVLMDTLTDAGIDQAAIDRMFDILQPAIDQEEASAPFFLTAAQPNSIRYFSLDEKDKIASDARNYLFTLEQNRFINAEQREVIIEHAMDVDVPEVDLHIIKSISTAIVTKNSEVREAVWMEFLIYPERYRTLIHN